MKRPLSSLALAAALPLLGACHFHSRAWLEQHQGGKTPTVVQDTQPIVKQAGEPVHDAEPIPSRPSEASKQMARGSIAATDARTIGMFLMANDVDLSFAKIAYINSGSDDVKAFARRMLTDHTQLVSSMRGLVSDHDMSLSDDDAGQDLRDLSTVQRDSLRALTGRVFDSTYVAMELDRHRAMLSMIDDVLLPRARSSELREMLASTRPVIAAHVAHAEQLQAAMRKR